MQLQLADTKVAQTIFLQMVILRRWLYRKHLSLERTTSGTRLSPDKKPTPFFVSSNTMKIGANSLTQPFASGAFFKNQS